MHHMQKVNTRTWEVVVKMGNNSGPRILPRWALHSHVVSHVVFNVAPTVKSDKWLLLEMYNVFHRTIVSKIKRDDHTFNKHHQLPDMPEHQLFHLWIQIQFWILPKVVDSFYLVSCNKNIMCRDVKITTTCRCN